MSNEVMDISVLFFIYKRASIAYRVFERIREAKPSRLFIVSDGPQKEEEREEINSVRKIVNKVDWKCEVHTNFSEMNLGCDKRIESGITWAFQFTDKVIILEDDCLPTFQFFTFCHAMLDKYEYEEKIAYISGGIGIQGYKYPYDYFYSYLGYKWGWATWRDRWELFEYGTERFDEQKEKYMIGVFDEKVRKSKLANINKHFTRGEFPWDYIWDICTNEMLRIVPKVNLVENIGFTEDSTHTFMRPHGYYGKLGTISGEFTHPMQISNNQSYIEWYQKKTKYHLWDRVAGKSKWFVYQMKDKKNQLWK